MKAIGSVFSLLAILVGMFSAPTVTLAETPLDFPAGYWTFEEVASRLSTGGDTVCCDDSLMPYAAVISIKSRSRSEVIALLEKGLDIVVEPVEKQPHRFVMRRDSRVRIRENTWRKVVAAILQERLQQNIDTQLGSDAWKQPIPSPAEDVKAQEEMSFYNAASQQTTDQEQRAIYYQKFRAAEKILDQPHAGARLSIEWYQRNPQPILDLFSHHEHTYLIPISTLRPDTAAHLVTEIAGASEKLGLGRSRYTTDGIFLWANFSLRRNSVIIQFMGSFSTVDENGSALHTTARNPALIAQIQGLSGAKSLLQDIAAQPIGDKISPGFRRTATSEIVTQLENTERSLGLPIAAEKVVIPPTKEFSAWIANWAKQKEQEVVFEVYPQNDVSYIELQGAESLAGLVRKNYEVKSDWKIDCVDNVLLIKNAWAFWDRARFAATAPFVSLMRNPAKDSQSPISLDTWTTVVAELIKVSEHTDRVAQHRSKFGTEQSEYNGYKLYQFESGLLAGCVLHILDSPALRQKIGTLASSKPATPQERRAAVLRIPLTQLGSVQLKQLAKVRSTYLAPSDPFDNRETASLDQYSLTIKEIEPYQGKRHFQMGLEGTDAKQNLRGISFSDFVLDK